MSADLTFQFVDTNILVYAHGSSAGEKQVQAKALISNLWDSGAGCLSVQVLQEFYVTVTQKVRQPLQREVATQIVEALSFWRVYAPDAKDVLAAIALQQRHQLSFWDAMIVYSAAQLGCQTLWSEGLGAGRFYEGVRVLNPFQVAGPPHSD